ncbi:Beta-lysine acetyltransferase [Methanosarcina siciliae HI350]|uniref:Beta-lysine acetyltransferase n=1 Tax=Methanosarcina siciliae HI350 TaxID=1434119 RepID=A0A0E3PGQ7_9EURY|nr:putative beta-lysine N-acetyltransferase [Methanosarcina siciliae]AKB33939.1 Beta-lysine acetyltransferase [Methanosarcina siciliae HI350]
MPGAGAELVIDYYNKRIKVMEFTGLFEALSGNLEALAEAEEMGKIIVYTLPKKGNEVRTCGYVEEGIIGGYYSGKDCHIFSSYPEIPRGISFQREKEDQILKNCLRKKRETGKRRQKKGGSRKMESWKQQKEKICLPEGYILRPAVQADASAMAALYRQGFQLYPAPLHMESYLLETMDSNVLYLLVEKRGEIVSLASAEMDPDNASAEITDCLTVLSERGKGLMKELIKALEEELSERNFLSSYTLCRASSPGINSSFASLGYTCTGRLVNNCRIGKGFEDMNIWSKLLK